MRAGRRLLFQPPHNSPRGPRAIGYGIHYFAPAVDAIAYAPLWAQGAVAVLDIEHEGACEPPRNGLVSLWPGDGTAHDVRGGRHGFTMEFASPQA